MILENASIMKEIKSPLVQIKDILTLAEMHLGKANNSPPITLQAHWASCRQARSQVLRLGENTFLGERFVFLLYVKINVFGHNKIWGGQKICGGTEFPHGYEPGDRGKF